MQAQVKKEKALKRRHMKVRKKISGTVSVPRLCVSRSLRNISAQVIDDEAGKTIVSVSTMGKGFDGTNGGNSEAAKAMGKLIAEKAKEKNVEKVVFDRGGRKFHGRVKAFADAAREGGLVF